MTTVTGETPEIRDAPPLRPVLTLTEEELLVLTNGSLGVVPARVHEPEDPEVAALVRSVVLRGLMARGLVLPTGERLSGDAFPEDGSPPRTDPEEGGPPRTDPEDGGPSRTAQQAGAGRRTDATQPPGVAWEAVEPLGVTLSVRELAPAVLGLRRVLGALQDPAAQPREPETEDTSAVRYLHLHGEIAVIEDVTDAGMHNLLPVFPDRYHDAVADFIKPPDATAGRGGVRSLDDGNVEELLASLGRPTVLVETSLLTGLGQGAPPEPVTQMLALGPGGCFRSHDSVTYHPVDPDGVIAELLRDVPLGPDQPDTGWPGEGTAPVEGVASGEGAASVEGSESWEGSGAGAGGPT